MSGLEFTQVSGSSPVSVVVEGVTIADLHDDRLTAQSGVELLSTVSTSIPNSTASHVITFHDSTENTICFKNSAGVKSCLGLSASNYVYAYDSTSQAAGSSNTFQNVTFNTNGVINGWTHTPGTADFVCPANGVYAIAYVLHIGLDTLLSLVTVTASARLTVNGSELAGSQSVALFPVQAASTANLVVANSLAASLAAADILRVQYAISNTIADLEPAGLGDTPVSASVTVVRV